MANKKLSELPLVSAVSGADALLVNGNTRITVADFADSLAGSAITCAVTGGPLIDHGYPVVTGNLRLRNGATPEGVTVSVYFGNSSGGDWRLDGSALTDADGNFAYAAKPKGDGVRTVQARAGALWSSPYDLTTDQIDVAPVRVFPALDWVMEGLPAGTPITRLDVEGGIVQDGFTFELTDSQGGRFALSGNMLIQGATSTARAGGLTRAPKVRATSIYTGLSVETTVTMRVFATPDWTTEPTAGDPASLGLNVVLDVNPVVANINSGSVADGDRINSAVFSGFGFVPLSTTLYKPRWIADAGHGKPCLRCDTANQGLRSTDAALCAAFDGDHPVLTIISMHKQSAITGGSQFVFATRQAATTDNPPGQRMILRADNGQVILGLGDDEGNGSITSASALGNSNLSVGDTTCAFVMNGSMQGCGLERDFDYTSRFGNHAKTGNPFSASSTGTIEVVVADKGGQAAGMVGDYYRQFVIAGIPTLRQRYAICKWAHAEYELSHPPAWAPLDMATKVVTYDTDSHITTGIYDIVKHGAVRGDETPAHLGWQSLSAGSTSTQYAGWINNSEDTGFPNILDPVWRDQVTDPNDSDVWHYWQKMLVGETRLCPVGYEPYVLLNGVQKQYIGPMLSGRYGGKKYMHGQYSGEYWMSQKARGGKGMWGGIWTLGDASSSSTTYNEQDVQEQDGADVYGLHTTTHDATLSGGASGHYFIVDDQTQGLNHVCVDVQPDYTAYYMNGILMWRMATPVRNQGAKYGLVDLTTGKTPSAFFGACDNTTVFPNYLVVRRLKFTRNPIAAPVVIAGTPAEASDLLAAMTAPTSLEQATIVNAIKQLKGYISRYPDGTDYSLFQKLNYLYFLAMQVPGNCLRDWRSAARTPAAIMGTPAFTAGQGFRANTNGDYIDTGILMPSAGFANNAADQSMGVWNLSQPSAYANRFAHGDDKYQINPSPAITGTGKTNTLYLTFGQSGTEVLYNDVGPGCHTWSRGFGQATPWFNGAINGVFASQTTTALDAAGVAFTSTNARRILSSSLNATSATFFDGKVAAAWAAAWLVEDHQTKIYDILNEALSVLGAI